MAVEIVIERTEQVVEILVQQGGSVDLAGIMSRLAVLEANQLPAPGTPGRILVDDGTGWVATVMGEETT